jgi:1,4-dihydroxy-2-naphthoate octaprenyltransferase
MVQGLRESVATIFLAARPKFLVASAAPVLVGSSLGYAVSGSFNPLLFVLALLGIMALHAGANLANDYYDHTSRNDWVNQNPTPFSGGSRYIQDGVLSARVILLMSLTCLAAGAIFGGVILLLTRSVFVLVLGMLGLLGGFFYTASPIRLGYRSVGEVVIFFLFGLLPVYGSYYLQTGEFDAAPILPGCVVGALIFLVILINEFPDAKADAAVNKRTLVVRFGVTTCVWVYRIALLSVFVVAATMLGRQKMFFAGLLFLLTLPIAYVGLKAANAKDLSKPGEYRASQLTVVEHAVGSLAMSVGFAATGVLGMVS